MGKQKETYVKLFHRLLGWEWYKDANTMRVFLHILLKANYKPTEYRGYKLQAGDCIFGRKAWAEELGLSERQIRTAIDHLKSTNEIATKSTNKFTIIHIEKWAFWQLGEGKSVQQSDQQEVKRATTSKEYIDIYTHTYTNNKGRATLEEVKKYVVEKNLVIDPDFFYEYYEELDWCDKGGQPIKSWKLKARTWDRKERERKNGSHDDRRGSEQRTRICEADGRSEEGDDGSGEETWQGFIPMA